MLEERKRIEREFHDRLSHERDTSGLADRNQGSLREWFYSITQRGDAIVHEWLRSHAQGKRVLDLCCGTGQWSLEFARHAAHVWGVDISHGAIRSATDTLRSTGCRGKATFVVMDAENLAFPNGTFDLIFCAGAIHHLDSTKVYQELARVLKADGKIMCVEPLGYNPLINAFRKLTPGLRTPWELTHTFTLREINEAKKHFANVQTTFLYLASLLAILFKNTRVFASVLSILERLDSWLLSLPHVRLLAWQVIIVMTEPRSEK
jgi:ubiquinone/menaquinone biosynthesis C-methylase UbiE